jgi:hypothetical protein
MKARTTRLKHAVDLGAHDDQARVAMGFVYGLVISAALWGPGAAVVLLLI